MLTSETRPITPEQIRDQIPWEDFETVVIIGQKPKGKTNSLFMSSLTIEELCVLSKQLDAHITCLLGPMKEGE
jgi:hypothetical protein